MSQLPDHNLFGAFTGDGQRRWRNAHAVGNHRYRKMPLLLRISFPLHKLKFTMCFDHIKFLHNINIQIFVTKRLERRTSWECTLSLFDLISNQCPRLVKVLVSNCNLAVHIKTFYSIELSLWVYFHFGAFVVGRPMERKPLEPTLQASQPPFLAACQGAVFRARPHVGQNKTSLDTCARFEA